MKLRIKNLNWTAGKPVVFLNDKTAKRLNVFVDDRLMLSNGHKVHAIVDLFPKIIKRDEIGVSKEVSSIIKLKSGGLVDVTVAEVTGVAQLINKKISGKQLKSKELIKIIEAIVNNKVTEAEIAYFTAAERLSGMSMKETVALTEAMVKTGAKLKFKGKYIADKHCIGGIAGNRTTPIIVSICAAAGITIPKTSSRAITSASGTADVIETISNVEIQLNKLKKIVEKVGACLAWGGSLGLAPSDDKIIHIERLLNLDIEPQLLASIMSKKVAAGAKYLLIDIPYGRGAKVNTLKAAKSLGRKFEKLGRHFRIKLKVIYTNGSQPIGNGFGPTLEMIDVLAVLNNEGPKDLKNKSLFLSSELMKLCGIKDAKKKAEKILSSGKAMEKFREIIIAQNGKNNFEKKVDSLKKAKIKRTIKVEKEGKITRIDNKGINSLCRILGTPETKGAGAYLHYHLGKVEKGRPLITLYSESKTKMREALRFWKERKPIRIR
jgi:AMP phosphorylase